MLFQPNEVDVLQYIRKYPELVQKQEEGRAQQQPDPHAGKQERVNEAEAIIPRLIDESVLDYQTNAVNAIRGNRISEPSRRRSTTNKYNIEKADDYKFRGTRSLHMTEYNNHGQHVKQFELQSMNSENLNTEEHPDTKRDIKINSILTPLHRLKMKKRLSGQKNFKDEQEPQAVIPNILQSSSERFFKCHFTENPDN